MNRARLETLFVTLLAACGGTTSSSAQDTDGGTDSTSSSSGSSGFNCNPPSNVETYDVATSCRALRDARADAGADASADGDAEVDAATEAGIDSGIDEQCTGVTCNDLCAAAGQQAHGFARVPDECAISGSALTCTFHGHCGRRFCGMDEPYGCVLAAATYLEAASVIAFDVLARDLAFHGAPEELVLAALKSKVDEERHVAAMRALCDDRGVFLLDEPRATRWRPRSLFEVARENAVEGCVGETWGALVALAQARFAADAKVRVTMSAIASDELDHAALAHAIDAWIRPQLRADDLRRLDEDVAVAKTRLAADAPRAVDPASSIDLGIPIGDVAASLVAQMFEAVGTA
jgi:hypothetical protein